jgi:hypothetical protein
MTFWKWTFLKIDKCPNLISSKKCFLGALKNLEENIGLIVALKMLQKTTICIQSWKNILGFFWTFLDKYSDIFNKFTQFTLSKRVILFFKNIKQFIPLQNIV